MPMKYLRFPKSLISNNCAKDLTVFFSRERRALLSRILRVVVRAFYSSSIMARTNLNRFFHEFKNWFEIIQNFLKQRRGSVRLEESYINSKLFYLSLFGCIDVDMTNAGIHLQKQER